MTEGSGGNKGTFAFLSIFGFESEAREKGCPTSEIFKGKDYI